MNITLVDSKKHKRINKFIEWIIYMIGYALRLISLSVIFKNTIQIDNNLKVLLYQNQKKTLILEHLMNLYIV